MFGCSKFKVDFEDLFLLSGVGFLHVGGIYLINWTLKPRWVRALNLSPSWKGSVQKDLLLGLNFVSKISCFHLNGVGNSNSMLLRPPFDTLLRFNRCPLPLTAFLSTNEQKAEPSRSKPSRSKPDARGQKWKKGFQERCKALGHVPRLDLYVCGFPSFAFNLVLVRSIPLIEHPSDSIMVITDPSTFLHTSTSLGTSAGTSGDAPRHEVAFDRP